MLTSVLLGTAATELGIIALLMKSRVTMRNTRDNYPGVFIQYRKDKNNKLHVVYSNDKSITKIEDAIPSSHISQCREVFDEYMTNGSADFTCEKDGHAYNVNIKRSTKNDAFIIVSDVTSIKRISDRAYIDTLTGLPNRLAFNERLKGAISYAFMSDRIMAVMFLDLDKFKQVNDTHGHEAGDLLLKQVSQRLCGVIRAGDMVARLGGDEFTILLPHMAKVDFAYTIADRIITELTTPFDLNGVIANISTSIGIAIYPNHGQDADTILKNADAAMYVAKNGGRGIYKVYGQN